MLRRFLAAALAVLTLLAPLPVLAAQLMLTGVGQGGFPASGISLAAYTGQIATRTFVANNTTGTETQCMVRTKIVFPFGATSFKVAYPAWGVGISGNVGTETDANSALTIKTGVEYNGANLGLLQWSASNTTTAAGGTTALSDTFTTTIPAGGVVYLRTLVTKASAGIPVLNPSNNGPIDYAGGEAAHCTAGSETDLTGSTGTITNNMVSMYYPVAVIGTTTHPSFMFIGDSRMACIQDTPDALGNCGEGGRMVGASYPWMDLGVGSESNLTWVKNSPYRRALFQYVSHAIINHAANDFYTGGRGATVAETTAHARNLWDSLYGRQPLTLLTIPPQTTSSDSWATTANQTSNGGVANEITWNAFIRTTPAPASAYVEVADAVQSAHDSGKWAVDGTTFKYTPDGLHQSAFGYAAAAAAGNADILAALPVVAANWTPFALMPVGGVLYGFWGDQLEYVSRPSGLTGGSSVSTWNSRSSGGSFSQTGGARPTVSAAAFGTVDGFTFASASTQYLAGGGATSLQGALNSRPAAVAWAVVKKAATTSGFEEILEYRGGGGLVRMAVGINFTGGVMKAVSLNRRLDADSSTTVTGATTLTSGTSYILVWYNSPATNTTIIRVNGTVDVSTTGFTSSGNWDSTSSTVTIGGSSSGTSTLNGTLGEVGVAPTATSFSSTDFDKLECYLSTKYSISISHGC